MINYPAREEPPTRRPLFTARTAQELREVLDSQQMSVRELARRLDVSPMWVSRRARGEVPIAPEDTERIRANLADLPPF